MDLMPVKKGVCALREVSRIIAALLANSRGWEGAVVSKRLHLLRA